MAVVLLLTSGPVGLAAPSPGRVGHAVRAQGSKDLRVASPREFKDVPATHWAYTAIRSLNRRKILVGLPGGKFAGEQPVTRYELALALYRLVQALDERKAPASVPNARVGPAAWLAANHYLTDDSPLLHGPATAPVSAAELSDSMAYVADRILLHRAAPDELKGD